MHCKLQREVGWEELGTCLTLQKAAHQWIPISRTNVLVFQRSCVPYSVEKLGSRSAT